ncbi:hypothetical protein ILT44_14320 [Microvirga sp. BT689]|nr:hypothetical protein [Microvirga arvi]
MLENGGWVVTWTGQDSSGQGVFQRRYEAVAAFGAGLEDGFGTAGNEVFDALSGGLGTGDTLEAGGGIDTLRMIESGTLDLTAPARFADVEIVQGSSGSDVVVTNAIRLGGVFGLQGGAGRDELRLEAGTYDFTTKFVSGFESITLTGAGSLTFADKATALLAHSQGQSGNVILLGDSFTAGERQKLYDQGIRQVTDADGVHILQPAVASLSAATVQENAGTGSIVGTLSAADPSPGDGKDLRFDLIDGAGGRFAVSGSRIVVANGALLDHETATSHTIRVRVIDEGGITVEKAFTISVDDIPVETMRGTASADRLSGGTSKDVLYGGLGRDTLTGGAGEDIFVFDTKPNKKSNLNKIVDFSVKDDTIWLDNAVFTKLGKAGSATKPAPLKKDFFTVGSKAKDKNDHVVYDKAKGVLYYDADGSGNGKAVEIATLTKKLGLTYKDFFVV